MSDYVSKKAIRYKLDVKTEEEKEKIWDKIFDDYNLSSIIANKYKLNNLKIEESDISEENIISLYNKIKLILRAGIIDKSNSSVEKIWFMVQTKKILDSEQVENVDTEEE